MTGTYRNRWKQFAGWGILSALFVLLLASMSCRLVSIQGSGPSPPTAADLPPEAATATVLKSDPRTRAPAPSPSPSSSTTPRFTVTQTPSATEISALEQAATATYEALNIQRLPQFTVYWKRDLWSAASEQVQTEIEDFERENAGGDVLALPYLTSTGILLSGDVAAQILFAPSLLNSGNVLHFRDEGGGLTFGFPGNVPVLLIGFDYRAPEEWELDFGTLRLAIPTGPGGFVGIIAHGENPSAFALHTSARVQRGFTIDNIVYIPADF